MKTSGAGKRGKYITDDMRADALRLEIARATADLRPAHADAAAWGRQTEHMVAELLPKAEEMGLDATGVYCYAVATVARKFAKGRPAGG